MKNFYSIQFWRNTLCVLLLTFSAFTLQAQDTYYWTGNGADNNWATLQNWEVNGGIPVVIPAVDDQVIFDNTKFTTDQTVTFSGDAICASLDMTTVTTNTVTLQMSGNSLTVAGNLRLSNQVDIPNTDIWSQTPFILTGVGAANTYTLSLGGKNHPFVSFQVNAEGKYQINEDTQLGRITFTKGTLEITTGHTLDTRGLITNGNDAKVLNMAGATILATAPNWSGAWSVSNFTLNDDTNSLIKLSGTEILMRGGTGVTYNKVEFGDASTNTVILENQFTINEAILNGNTTFKTNGITFNDLTVNNSAAFLISNNVQININQSLNANGTCDKPILWSTNVGGSINFQGTTFSVSNIRVNNVANSSGNALTLNDSYSLGNPGSTSDYSWTFNPSATQDFYWVGGTTTATDNKWSNSNNWRIGSTTGATTTCIPGPNDNVFFVDGSFVGGSQTVDVDIRAIYCRDMTWQLNTATPTFSSTNTHNSTTSNNFYIYGSLEWDNAMNQNFACYTYFRGSGNHTITSNGKTFLSDVLFNSTGTYTLNDAFSTFNGVSSYYSFYLQSGTLDFNNQDFTCGFFFSYTADTKGPRKLYLRNSNVNIYYQFKVQDVAQGAPYDLDIDAGTSTVYMQGILAGSVYGPLFDGGLQNYHHIEYLSGADKFASFYNSGNVESIIVRNRNITVASVAPSKVNNLTFTDQSSGNFQGNSLYGNVTLDAGQVYNFQRGQTQTIDQLTAVGNCSQPIIMQDFLTGGTPLLSIGSANVAYLHITNVNAENTTTPGTDFTVNNGLDLGATPSTGWSLSLSTPRTLYWVGGNVAGGSGNWGDQANWSLTSGGAGGECIPTPNDDVIFDNQSFNGTGPSTVNMDRPVHTCKDMTWTSTVTNNPTWTGTTPLQIYGSLSLADETVMTNNFLGVMTFKTNAPASVNTITIPGNQILNTGVNIDGDGTWNLASNLTIAQAFSYLRLKQGTLNLQGNTLDVRIFSSLYNSSRQLNIENSTITVAEWRITPTNLNLSASGSEIRFYAQDGYFVGGTGLSYHNLNFNQVGRAFIQQSDNLTINSVIFAGNSTNYLYGNNHNIGTVTFHKNGFIFGNHTIGDLILDPEPNATMVVKLESGSIQTISNNITTIGGNCVNISLEAITQGQQAIVSKSSGTVEAPFLSLRDIRAQGGATFNVYFGTDAGNNTGWNFLFSGTPVFTGLGPDIQLNPGTTQTLDATIPIPTPPAVIIYKWYKDGVLIPGATSSTLTVNEAGTYKVVICFDAQGTCSVEDEVIVTTPCNYKLSESSVICGGEEFCVWLEAKNNVPGGIIGMDYCLSYDPTIMEPTGQAELGSVVQSSGNHGQFYLNHQGNPGQVYASIYYNSSAPAGTYFTGQGQVICIRFRLKAGVSPQEVTLNACQVRETYALTEVEECADPGKLTITDGAGLTKARLIYWNQSNGVQPLAYDVNNPGNHLVTNIQGVDDNCTNPSAQIINPDTQGYFLFTNTNGTKLKITRDIEGDYNNPATNVSGADIMSVINGMDCYYAGLITTFATQDGANPWSPNAYQMLAADVNMNDVVAASDITLIQKRTIMQIQEYPQVWNYDYASNLTNPVPQNPVNISYDWRFVNQATLSNSDFQIAPNYPVYVGGSNNGGFWRDDVPNLDNCQPLQVGSACDVLSNNVYYGIMLGDVDGSWTTGANANLRTTAQGEISIDLLNAQKIDANTYKIPVKYSFNKTVHAIDFSFNYNSANIQINDAIRTLNGEEAKLNMAWNDYQNQKFLLTSYTMQGINSSEAVYYIEVNTNNLNASDFTDLKGFINGKSSNVNVITNSISNTLAAGNQVQINTYPNPASETLTVTHNINTQQAFNATLISIHGIKVNTSSKKDESGRIVMDVSQLASGVYIVQMRDTQGKLIASKKVLINR
ncbi:hypothetical protein BKI52_14275 [marine bacterium AO1-C]|nr:hypothetical protein BKI52_14275 [marine bacterium AO1-C]